MEKEARIYVAGHRGMVGAAIVRKLRAEGFDNLVLASRNELDLTNQPAVQQFFAEQKPEYVFMAAAKVGGIVANDTFPAEFLYENLLIEANTIHAAHQSGVKKLVFLGSSCIYPKFANQPIAESELLQGALEPTNKAYAIAKIAGIELCQSYARQYGCNFISVMPTNLYGPGDNYDLQHSHVLPALLRKFHEAKESGASAVSIWGSGSPRREFLHVDDLAEAVLFLMQNYDDPEIVNVGTGEDISIKDLAELIQDIVGFTGALEFDSSKPDGTPRKLLDVSRLHELGWRHTIGLKQGIQQVYADVSQTQFA